jgi:ADP-heptose:LPS heptosyltransferase
MKNYNKICVIHLNQIGDLIFSLPLLKSLKDHFPQASIHSVVRPYLKGLLTDSPYIDRIILRNDTNLDRLSLIWTLMRERYDLLISLARSEEALGIAGLSRAHLKAGFAHFPWDVCLDVKEVIQGNYSWFNNAKLLVRLGIPISQDNYVGLLHVDEYLQIKSLPMRYVVVSPGASSRRIAKTWGERKFASVIAQLSMEFGLGCVLVGGSDNSESTSTIARHVEHFLKGGVLQVVDLAGKTNLRELTEILKKASLFIGNDSGILHMASALDIPVVGIFGPTDPKYSGPQNARSAVVRKQLNCVPCYLREPCKHRRCLEELDAELVIKACRKVLTN